MLETILISLFSPQFACGPSYLYSGVFPPLTWGRGPRAGNLSDVVLGYDTAIEYMNNSGNFGAIVGRVANRIASAKFTLNGTLYKLEANGGNGTYSVHGNLKVCMLLGPSPYITMSYYSANGDKGFPGAVLSYITYALFERYKLSVTMMSKALNKATPVNLAQHNFWNLGGHDNGDILSDELQISASRITYG
ncbi:aldose 1-epimerase-like [Olea europaea subsp. europaea]|uniref:Aldose 1-epimerase-like n=1 Tax=Olea europaea subsp. europaea TaxID=158383 RepID=A0A8S0VF30_OLEEU|nr:aldose 1-epimerase-like [Olea europaea subsp. europaea]